MSTLPPDPSDSPGLVTLTEVLKSAPRPPTSEELEQGLDALKTRLSTRNPGRRRLVFWSRTAFAALCLLAATGLALTLHQQRSSSTARALTVARIDGAQLLDGGYLSAWGDAPVTLVFDEGSEFVLAPGTRGRLRAVNAEGAHFAIDQGTASFRITPNQQHRWAIEAGPFLVTVKGTEFTVVWDASSEWFEVRLEQGRVAVRGPVLGDNLVLRPGQKLSVSLPRAELVLSEASAERPPPDRAPGSSAPEGTSGDLAAPALASGKTSPPRASAAPAPGSSAAPAVAGGRRWSAALANGQWDRILADVEHAGLEATLESVSSSDLFALADAARYRRRAELARAALLAQRRRFPDSARSIEALFLLGRVEESRGSPAPAIRWYDEYLTRAPGGTYAAEALGRKMILVNTTDGPARARELAVEYLRRFPDGSYAGSALALQRVP